MQAPERAPQVPALSATDETRITPATLWLLAAIVLFGGIARFWNLNWDAGAYILHPDEWALDQVVRTLGPDLNPHFFFYGSFPIYLYHFTANALTFVTGVDWLDTTRVSLVGRFFSALESTLILPLLFLIGRRLWGTPAGLLAAAFAASIPLLLQAAHFGTVDTLVTVEGVTLLWLSLRIWDGAGMRVYVVTGIVLGLAVATKLTAASFIIMPALAYLLSPARRGNSSLFRKFVPLLVLLATAAIATLLTSPYYLLAWNELWAAVVEQSQELGGGYVLSYTWQFIGSTPYVFEMRNLVVWSVGIPVGISGLVGWIWLLAQGAMRRKNALLLLVVLSWPTLYLLYIGTWEARFVRHTLPLLPFVCLFAAGGLVALAACCAKHGALLRRGSRALVYAVLIVGILWGVAFMHIYTSPDTRLDATAWIRANIPQGTQLVVEDKDTLMPLYDAAHPASLYKYGVLKQIDPDNAQKMEATATTLAAGEILVMSSRRWSAVLPKLANYPLTTRYYDLLAEGKLGYTPLKTFSSPPTLGPLTFPDDTAEETFQVFDHPTITLYANTAHLSSAQLDVLLQPGKTAP